MANIQFSYNEKVQGNSRVFSTGTVKINRGFDTLVIDLPDAGQIACTRKSWERFVAQVNKEFEDDFDHLIAVACTVAGEVPGVWPVVDVREKTVLLTFNDPQEVPAHG